ncbi:hypothetical protein EJB05_36344, partial [Eragrostis curvula]
LSRNRRASQPAFNFIEILYCVAVFALLRHAAVALLRHAAVALLPHRRGRSVVPRASNFSASPSPSSSTSLPPASSTTPPAGPHHITKPFFRLFKFRLNRRIIYSSYCDLMKKIYIELERLLRLENMSLPESERFAEFVNGKLVTPKEGSFLVQIIPENEEEEPLTFLFRWKDLYLDSFHFDEVWYRLCDHEAELPPRKQLPYREKKGVVVLESISSRYDDLGGSNVDIGHLAFVRCYYTLRKTGRLCLSANGLQTLKSGALATPAVGISEAVRFAFHQRMVKNALKSGTTFHVTDSISKYFNMWGTFSQCMYTNVRPPCCLLSLVQISNRLWVIRRQDLAEAKSDGNEAEVPLKSLLAWHAEDKRRILHAVCNVRDLDRTVTFYKNSFAMKVLRTKDDPEENKATALVGFGPENNNFALKLDHEHGKKGYEIGAAFGHFGIATEDVNKLVKKAESKGGKITREPRINGGPAEVTFVHDPDNYRFELVQRVRTPDQLNKMMLRVCDIERSIRFYQKALGMTVISKKDFPKSQCTIASLGYPEKETVLELTYHYGVTEYAKGNAYEQVVIGTNDVYRSAKTVERLITVLGGAMLEKPCKLPRTNTVAMSFLDPDGWKLVLMDIGDFLNELQGIPGV